MPIDKLIRGVPPNHKCCAIFSRNFWFYNRVCHFPSCHFPSDLGHGIKNPSVAKIDISIYGEFEIGIYAHNLPILAEVKEHFAHLYFWICLFTLALILSFRRYLCRKNWTLILLEIESFTICTQTHTGTDKYKTVHICLSHILPLAKNQLKEMRAK